MQDLVVIPGLGSDNAVWARTMAALGDGVSTTVGNTLVDDSLEGMARRILAEGPPTFSLAGVSMGGIIALEIMRTQPHRVRTLTLVDTLARPDTPEQAAFRQAANAAVLAAPDLRALSESSLGYLIHPLAAQDIRQELIEMSARVGAQTYVRQNLAVAARPDFRPVLTSIAVPTQVIVGENDLMTPPAHSEEIHQAIAGSALHVIPACGHLPPIEKPDILAAHLKELMARRG